MHYDRPDTEDWLTGGESGPSIQNTNSGRRGEGLAGGIVDDLLRRAAMMGPPPTHQQQQFVPRIKDGSRGPELDPLEESTIRHLTFWRNGFTIEDGDLYRYDNPNNEQILLEIHAGRAPPSILNVRSGELVELRVAQRTTEDCVPPPAAPSLGAGHKLEAPVPKVAKTSTTVRGSGGMSGLFLLHTSYSLIYTHILTFVCSLHHCIVCGTD
ncbi:SEP-domain-containing protein [Dendrothele bispora CBS 962.96]|uniref:SEP-domain-containing protein n=1 Tax=Dendrothele bispora (strain CBS 962.96) TaxID=1314807 RepID=A0A4S8MG66_DENBC|nr:SEP-domain-containing protein [Dendrothele bispora CBS 962.96]